MKNDIFGAMQIALLSGEEGGGEERPLTIKEEQ